MDGAIQQALIAAALEARGHAYAPYSQFPVGAAVLADDGSVFSGANVENSSYGLSLCAERVAAAAAIAAGHRQLTAVAVATAGGKTPCGACRQFLAEFGNEIEVLLVDVEQPHAVRTLALDALLPEKFDIRGD